MSVSYLTYPLVNGYIHHWLVAGPQAVPIPEPQRFPKADRKPQIAGHYYEQDAGISQPPVDQASIQVGDTKLKWRYYRCLDDHFVDVSTDYPTWHYLRTWAYTQIQSPSCQEVTLVLTTNGPADLWLGGEHIHRQEHWHHQQPGSVAFQARLQEGDNELLVRFEEVAERECPYVMALQVAVPSAEASEAMVVRVPTGVSRLERFQIYEHVFEHAYLTHPVVHKGDEITLRWADDLDKRWRLTYLVRDERRRVYLDGTTEAKAATDSNVGHPARLWERPYHVALQAMPEEYWEQNMRHERCLPVHVLDGVYSLAPYGTYEQRRREALEDAARRENNVFAEIAKCALGRWAEVSSDVVLKAVDTINQRGDGAEGSTFRSDCDLVGLLGAMHRYMDDPAFPKQLKRPLTQCVLSFGYGPEEPSLDAICYTESHRIIAHTCEILAGQLYPDRVFANTGKRGRWHQQKGERLALDWLRKRGSSGFVEWDSNCSFEQDLLALSHLADLAANTDVSELAAILIDKTLFAMALNSFKGAFGSTHGRTYGPMILGSLLEPTSGISRLMWGMGVFNHHLQGTVSLACSEYELAPIIADIATNLPEEMWNRERHVAAPEEWPASGSLGPEVNKVTYRTPDYMLCSAQDYHPGEKGYQQHIWQATMGPEAVVFVNHPACMSENNAHHPGFWHGNDVLPRVAQWRGVLIAVHRLPDDDWMGFTHAYFPVHSFDEYQISGDWAFARKGGGYLALTAAKGLALVKRGPGAYRELRSDGQHNVWLCQMGRESVDGSFAEFCQKVLASGVEWQGLAVRYTALSGETLSFGWEGALVVEGKEQPITGFAHYENPYCVADLPVSQMEILYGDYLLRLHFA